MKTNLGAAVVALVLMTSTTAHAQSREFMLRGFGDIGATTFTAEQSFNAILGSRTGRVFGGGVEVVLPQRIFANVRASRFRESGQRVFLFEGERFDLGIPTTRCSGPRCPTRSVAARTACLTSSTSRTWAASPSASRSSWGCNTKGHRV